MVGVLDRNGHLLELEREVTAQVAGGVVRREVEVAGVVERHGHGGPARDGRVLLEVEELELGAHVQHVAGLVRGAEGPVEARARVAGERVSLRGADVAEDARNAALGGAPRKDLERAHVREGEHVGLLERGEAINGRAVEADTLLERLLEVLGGDGERLEVAEHVGEPKAHEADVALLDGAQDEIDVLLAAHADSSRGSAENT